MRSFFVGYFYTRGIQTAKEDGMATNPIGKGTKTIGINMQRGMAEDLEILKIIKIHI